MFGRKKRGPPHPAPNHGSTASAAAHSAAASAFLKSSTSTASLSAAAAAAALRARPTTPIAVADVQTKRTMRRANSNSSMGSSTAGSARGPSGAQLERRGSSGSMTERTFRDPSPNRGPGQTSMGVVPPVPAIPKNIAPPLPAKQPRRAASMETPAARMASPLPHQVSGRGSSLDSIRRSQPPPRSSQRGSSLSSVLELTDIDRPSSRGSVNFSYPTGSRESSPYGQRQLTSPARSSASQRTAAAQKQNLVFDPNSRTFIPESELLFYEQSIQDAANRPVKKKKKFAVNGATGTHLADSTVGGRIHGSALVSTRLASGFSQYSHTPPQYSDPQTAILGSRRKDNSAMASSKQDVESYTPPGSDYDSDNSERSPNFNTRRGKPLAKRPSMVREDREREEAEDETSKSLEREATLNKLEVGPREARDISPSPQPRATGPRVPKATRISAATPEMGNNDQSQAMSMPSPNLRTAVATTSIPDDAIIEPNDFKMEGRKAPRVHSISPVRVAHFLAAPESLAVRHQPLGRSVSPMKSALKHSPSSRGSSPNGEATTGNAKRGSSISDASDTPTMGSEEPSLPRKKSIRVSFDDESNVVLHQSDISMSPDSQATPGKRGWFAMGRGKRNDLTSISDDDSEVMKPRPALPSFGSVREKKYRDDDDRSLVTPTEAAESLRASTSSPFTDATGDGIHFPVRQSSDHAVGAVLASHQALKHATQKDHSNEPLPPEVTSVEGSGYISDDASSLYSMEKGNSAVRDEEVTKNITSKDTEGAGHSKSMENPVHQPSGAAQDPEVLPLKSNGNGAVPTLALTRASPTLAEIDLKSRNRDMPGQFPESSDSSLDDNPPIAVEHHPTEPTAAALGITEPDPMLQPPGSPKIGEIATDNQYRHPSHYDDETDDSDNNSIYSDAAEDFSDMQGDGFMSLDAVVESPISGFAGILSPAESSSSRNPIERASENIGVSTASSGPQRDDEWGKAQQYWSGLTNDKRKEMEQAALEETDDESVQEVKPAKGKSIMIEKPTRTAQAITPRSEPRHSRTYQIAPGAKAGPDLAGPAMRSSMRVKSVEHEDSGRMRKSMRTPGATSSSRHESSEAIPIPQQKASLQRKHRPRSTPQSEVRPSSTSPENMAVRVPTSVMPAAPIRKNVAASRLVPTLRRKGSSESDSSFKRARPATEGYHMKRSMRGPSQQQARGLQSAETTSRSGRFTLRSSSPNSRADRPPLSMPQTMRHNRKLSDDSYTPTLRSMPERSKSPLRFPGFGRSKLQSKSQPQAKAAASRASRFVDSSDEEDTRPSFRSRFIDSSDEEGESIPPQVAKPRPATALKVSRRTRDDESSDLPDTDDEKPSQPSKSARDANGNAPANTTRSPAHDGNALASGSLRRRGSNRELTAGSTTITSITATPPTNRRRDSLMSILRRTKPDPSSRVRKSDIESAARRDTPLERSRADLIAVRRQDSSFSTASGVASPKLLKRGVPSRTNTNENWPLPSTAPSGIDEMDEERPHTADDSDVIPATNGKQSDALNGRPDFVARKSNATGLADVNLGDVIPTRKKKRFPKLRRALRLDA